MKKMMSILCVLALLFSQFVTAMAEEGAAAPEIEKPVQISVVDEAGNPVTGAVMQLSDAQSGVLEAWNSDATNHTVFLKEGSYYLENLELPEGYTADTDEIRISVVPSEEEQVTDYIGTVTYDHDHTNICSNPNHVGLELYNLSDGTVAYCFNHGLKNPTEDSRYKMLVATPDLLYSYAMNKSDDITAQELYDHVLAAIYHSDDARVLFGLDEVEMRYITYIAIKSYTDPKCFPGFDKDGNNLLIRDENGKPVRDENGNYMYYPGGTVIGAVINHARGEKQTLDAKYIDAYNYLTGLTDHPANYFLYIYYPANFIAGDSQSFQCLMSARTVDPQLVTLKVHSVMNFEVTMTWNDNNNRFHQRPSVSAICDKLDLCANGAIVTDRYRDQIIVADNGDNSYSIRIFDLPKTDDNGEEAVYSLRTGRFTGYRADKALMLNGDVVTYTFSLFGDLRPIRPIKPIPNPIILAGLF